MTLTMTEDQELLVDAVRDFATQRLAPNAIEWDQTKHFPVDVLREAGEMGLGGIYTSEDVGGAGLSRLDAAIIFEELSKGDVALAAYISIHNMVVWMIDSFGNEAQRQQWIPKLASFEHRGSYCLTEPGAGSDAAATATTAKRDGDHYVLNGAKQFISGAGSSDVYIVMARTGGPGSGSAGISAFLVPAGVEGLSFGPNEKKMGWNTQPTRSVLFDDVRIPAENILGSEGDGFGIAMRGLNGGRINMAACSIGGAQWALERATQYLQERHAFGKPLAANQALVFTLADMATELRAARLMVRDAAHELDAGNPEIPVISAMAKRFATDAAFTAANSALQLFGGYGYLADYGIEKVVRDLRVHQILEGTNEIMRLIVGRSLLESK